MLLLLYCFSFRSLRFVCYQHILCCVFLMWHVFSCPLSCSEELEVIASVCDSLVRYWLLLLLLFATHLFVVVEGWRLGQMAPFQVEEEPAGDLERHQDKNRQEEETPLFLSHKHKHTSRGTYPPSRLRRLQEAALWPRSTPFPPSSQSSKINEAPVSVDNSIQNRFATIQEVFGTIPIS